MLTEAQRRTAPKWTKFRDDIDSLLWLMGGFAWAAGQGEEAQETFCQEHRMNSRQMQEAHSLMEQLATLLNRRLRLQDLGVVLHQPLQLLPPDPEQALKLRQCVLEGLVDHIAVAAPELHRNAFVCADLGPGRPVFVHSSSNVYRYKPRPTALAFNEILETSKPCMRDCVAIDLTHLARRAAAGDSPLLRLGEYLATPAPRYLPDQDSVLGFCSPKYTPLDLALPTMELEVPKDAIFRYKVFARALLSGEVLRGFPPAGQQLLAKPLLVLHTPNNPRVLGVVGPLWEARVGTRAELLARWKRDERFLLEGVLKWLPSKAHDGVRAAWPPRA